MLIISACAVIFLSLSAQIGGQSVGARSEEIDLSGIPLQSLEGIEDCTRLQKLNVSGCGLEDISAAAGCTALRELDLRGNPIAPAQYEALHAAIPECEIMWSVPIGGRLFDSHETRDLKLDSGMSGELKNMQYLQGLERADATEFTDTAELTETARLLGARVNWTVSVCAAQVTGDSSELVLTQPTAEDIAKLPMLRGLKRVEAPGCELYEQLAAAAREMPECEFVWDVSLYGVKANSGSTELILNGISIGDTSELYEKLQYLPELKRVEMCGCGVPNEGMEQLMESFPEIKFVWSITIGGGSVWWTVRTDAVAFSTLGRDSFYQETFEPIFKYCTDLVALDLGHQRIYNLDTLVNLKKLKVLILADSRLTDVSPISQLTELEYVELFLNDIEDISPLAGLEHLTDLHLGGNKIKDLTPLYSLKNLRMLWIQRNNLSMEQRQGIVRALPDCKFSFTCQRDLIEGGWRSAERNVAIRKVFKNWKYVTAYNSWDDVTYQEGAPIAETKPIYI